MKQLKFHPSVLLAVLFPLLGILSWGQTGLLWLSAALHELAHVGAYRLCGTTMESVQILPFGICAIPKDEYKISPENEVFCAAAGPFVNLLISVLILALPFPAKNETVRYLLYCNGALFLINVLPILPLDGGRILFFSLARKFDGARCEQVCYRCAILFLILLLFPVCAALLGNKNPSLALIWGYLTVYTFLRRGSV